MTAQPGSLDSSTPSAAREALQSNLDSTLTLNRKKSWFGSARDAFHRGAKGVVDHLRNDRKGTYANDQENANPEDDDGSSSGNHASADNDSLTPLHPSRPERWNAATPKGTISSLRQHIHTSGRTRGKRGALADNTTGGANEARDSNEPRLCLTTDHASHEEAQPEVKSPTKQHGRKSSVAKSMIGSLRSLSRRGTVSKPTSPTSDCGSPTKGAFALALPSSPIDIPAPTLKLNLGDTANISTSFLHYPAIDGPAELKAATDSATSQSPILPKYYTRLPGQGPEDNLASTDGLDYHQKRSDRELLEMPLDDFGLKAPGRPATPMPDTDAQMELNGTTGVFDEPPLFERSVEARDTPEKRDNKSVRKMISLDALAEQHVKESPVRGIRLTPASARKVRDFSGTTVQTCPEDMPALTRQPAALSTPSADRRDPMTGHWKNDDPFACGNTATNIAADSGVSTAKGLVVSDRPRITVHTVDASLKSDMTALPCNEATACLDSASLPTKLPESDMRLGEPQARNIAARLAVGHTAQPKPTGSTQKVPSVQKSLNMLQESTKAFSSQASSRLSSAQYDQFHPEHFLGLQECEDTDPPLSIAATEDQSSMRDSLVQENVKPDAVQHCSVESQTRSATTQSPELRPDSEVGDMFWKFSVQDWMHKREQSRSPSLGSSPRQRPCADSAESLPDGINPLVTSRQRPPSMGDRLSFDLKRSNRNMRYNALTNTSNDSVAEYCDGNRTRTSALPSPVRHDHMLDVENLAAARDRNSSFPDFEIVFPAPATSSKKGKQSTTQSQNVAGYEPSSESIESELEQVITDHYVFQSALASVGVTEYPDLRGMTADPHRAGSNERVDRFSETECGFVRKAMELRSNAGTGQNPYRAEDISTEHRGCDLSSLGTPGMDGIQDDNSFGILASLPTDGETLEDCMVLYKNYDACQGHFPGDDASSEVQFSPEAQSSPVAGAVSSPQYRKAGNLRQVEWVPASPKSAASAGSPSGSGSPARKTPARYRSGKKRSTEIN